jgi:hypothetical protein
VSETIGVSSLELAKTKMSSTSVHRCRIGKLRESATVRLHSFKLVFGDPGHGHVIAFFHVGDFVRRSECAVLPFHFHNEVHVRTARLYVVLSASPHTISSGRPGMDSHGEFSSRKIMCSVSWIRFEAFEGLAARRASANEAAVHSHPTHNIVSNTIA